MKTTKFLRVANIIGSQAKTDELSSIESIKVFIKMLWDWFNGKYKPKRKNLLIGTLVLIYVISPIDLIPGLILDDAVVVIFALKYFKKELIDYYNWKKSEKFETTIVVNSSNS